MSWLGTWRNQYGSLLHITDDRDNRIVGSFKTSLADSGFYGQEIPVVGVHYGDCIGLSGGGKATAGDMVVTYTGLLRDGRLETLWHVVADSTIAAPAEGAPGQVKKLGWWRSMTTNADTFERVS